MITKENIGALMDFGGLLVYEVSWFNPVPWQTVVDTRTFNEGHAINRLSSLIADGREAKMTEYMVQFDQRGGANND